MQGHHSSTLDVSELIAAGCGVHISIEELGHGGAVLWEVGVGSTLLPLLVEVHNVIGCGTEKFVKFFVFEDLI